MATQSGEYCEMFYKIQQVASLKGPLLRCLQAPEVFDTTVGEREFEEKARQSRISFSASQVHRLVVVDEQEVVRGIVSLSDILQALVLTDGYAGESSHSFVGLRRPVFPPHNVCSGFHRRCVRKPQKQDIFLEGGVSGRGSKASGHVGHHHRVSGKNHLSFP